MTRKIKHLPRLLGLITYIALGTSGCIATVYGTVAALYDFVFHVTFSLAHIASAIVGLLVLYALYSIHAEEIDESLDSIREQFFSKRLKRSRQINVLSAIAASLFAAALFVGISTGPRDLNSSPTGQNGRGMQGSSKKTESSHGPAKVLTAPTNRAFNAPEISEPPDQTPNLQPTLTPAIPIEENVDTRKSAGLPPGEIVPLPPRRGKRQTQITMTDVCDLNGVFSAQEFEACLRDIRKHPGRSGKGGRAYDVWKDRDKWILREHRTKHYQPRGPRTVPPLDIRPHLP